MLYLLSSNYNSIPHTQKGKDRKWPCTHHIDGWHYCIVIINNYQLKLLFTFLTAILITIIDIILNIVNLCLHFISLIREKLGVGDHALASYVQYVFFFLLRYLPATQ